MEKNNLPAVHSINELMSTAKLFAESGMFADSKSMAQAFVKIQAGAELGIPPFSAMSGVHIIQGKPAIGAGLMASRVKASGKYDYQVIEQTDGICRIEYFQGKKSLGISEFTLADAKKAQTKNIEKFPKNMLFARAMSNGVKWFCPDVFTGPVYVPEEMNVVEDTTYAEVKEDAAVVVEDSITDEMQQIINEAKTVADVKSIWDAHEVLHNSKAFKKAIKAGKERAFELQIAQEAAPTVDEPAQTFSPSV